MISNAVNSITRNFNAFFIQPFKAIRVSNEHREMYMYQDRIEKNLFYKINIFIENLKDDDLNYENIIKIIENYQDEWNALVGRPIGNTRNYESTINSAIDYFNEVILKRDEPLNFNNDDNNLEKKNFYIYFILSSLVNGGNDSSKYNEKHNKEDIDELIRDLGDPNHIEYKPLKTQMYTGTPSHSFRPPVDPNAHKKLKNQQQVYKTHKKNKKNKYEKNKTRKQKDDVINEIKTRKNKKSIK